MDKDPTPQVRPIESIINQTLYITSQPQSDKLTSTSTTPNLPPYQITPEKQIKGH